MNKSISAGIFPWGHTRRFNSYAEYFKHHFGARVQKLTLDAGFTCPNRDGTLGYGGCTYCNNEAFNPSYNTPAKSISQQLQEGIDFHKIRYRKAQKYLAYFQAYSNTYKPLTELKKMYSEALNFPNIIGLVIGTRPDCVNEELLDYLKKISEQYYILIEYGIESIYNTTLNKINRCHTFEQSVKALELTKKYGLKTGAHFIIGLPGENEDMILQAIPIISSLPIDNIKFHQLQIVTNTIMAKQYIQNQELFKFFSLNEYLELMVNITEQLNPFIVIERIASETPPRFIVGPSWGLIRIKDIMELFEKKLEEKNTWQGKYFKNN